MNEQRTVKFSELVKFSDKQKLACKEADEHRFTLYGGAAGGGKSYWLRWYAIRWLIKTYKETGIEGLQAALFSEDYPTLKDRHVGKLELEVPNWLGQLKEDKAYGLCVKLDPAFGGGVLLLRNLDDPSKYMSTEFALEAVDELTKNPPEVFYNLRARLRWPGLKQTKFIAGTNPGGPGHEWVKKIWVDRVFPPQEKEEEQFAYIPATADDNPFIDPSYLLALESLPERMRKALREGDWNIFEGQFFTEFQKEQHVVPTTPYLEIPSHWVKFRNIDVSGRAGVTCCYWHALDPDGNVWTYREYFATGHDSDEHAKNIWEMSHYTDRDTQQLTFEPYKYTVMDSAAWAKMGMSETTAEIYLRVWQDLDSKNFISSPDALVPASKERVMGADIVHQYLRWDEQTKPKWRIMDCCKNLIRTLPLLVHSEKNPDDVEDMPGTDDPYDANRYGLMTLRDQKSPKSENPIQAKLRQMKEFNERLQFNNYHK